MRVFNFALFAKAEQATGNIPVGLGRASRQQENTCGTIMYYYCATGIFL